jgi:MSHA biogenesis protein MshJ
MSAAIGRLRERVDALTLRERIFVLVAALIVAGGLWEALLAGPLAAREQTATEQVEAARERIEQMNRTLVLTATGMSEGMPARLARADSLRERVRGNRDELHVFTSDLVNPAQMRDVLEDLIRRQPGLELVRMSNAPSEPMFEDEDAAEVGLRLYRHALVIELEGAYLDALAYLREIEQLPWQFYWSHLDVHTDAYPLTQVVIELSTLSLDEEWIGV